MEERSSFLLKILKRRHGARRPWRLRRDENGSTAVEFAIIAPIFFFLMFVIAETALVFVAEQVMDNAVFETARLIRTGNAQDMSKADFTNEVCSRMSVFIDCSGSNFYLDVKSYPTFDSMVFDQPTDDDDDFTDPGTFEFGGPCDIVVVRAYYQWPTNKIFGSLSLQNLSNGKRLIGSFAAFRNEPFRKLHWMTLMPGRNSPSFAAGSLRARLSRALHRLACRESGMAAVEFSLILPILVLLWIGGVEVTQALSIDRRLNNLASAVGDLSARSKTLSYSDVSNILSIAPGAMFPYSTGGLQLRVSAVDISSGGDAKVAWSRVSGSGITAYADAENVNSVVPEALRVNDSQVIMAEVYYVYTPAVGYVITGNLNLDDRMFFVPRLTQYVKLCDDDGANCKS